MLHQYQKYFPTYFATIYRNYQKFINSELKQYDITSTEFPYFVMLLQYPNGILQDEICKQTTTSKSIATRALQSLEEKGYIYRKLSQHSQRHYEVFLYQKGIEILPIIQKTLDKWTDWLLSDFDNDTSAQMILQLRQIKEKALNMDQIDIKR